MAEEHASVRKPAVAGRRPAIASRIHAGPTAVRPMTAARTLQQRLGNQGTQAFAAHQAVARSSAPGMASTSGVATGLLSVSQPGDPQEREAERVADRILRMPEPAPQISSVSPAPAIARAVVVQRQCAACEEEGAHDAASIKETVSGGPSLHRQEGSTTAQHVAPSVSADIQALQGRGSPLPAATRAFFEPRFGADFSQVRVHTDTHAARTASSIDAKAFTVGPDIAFGAGQFSPDSHTGRRLLAHELTHTVQQGNGREVARQVLARQPDAGPGDAGPQDAGGAGETRLHHGEVVSIEANYTYDLLKRMTIANGYGATGDFVDSFYLEVVLPRRPAAGVSDDPELMRDASILSTLQEQFKKLSDERDAFTATFESEARSVTREFLDENQRHVLSEAIRYGVGDLHVEFRLLGWPQIVGDVADNASTRGLAIAAQGLLDRKRKADKAMSHYMEFTHGAPAFAELASQRLHSQEAEIAEKLDAVHHTQKDLEVYRVQIELQFPILADLGGEQDFKWSELEDLAKGKKGKDSSATKVIIDQIAEKLTNIHKVREEIEPGGDLNVWLVPEIVDPLREKLSATPGTLYGRIVDDKIKDEKPGVITGILIGLLQLGLVLLAPATGGLTLIPAAAISVGTAYEHFKEYQLKKAMHGTDFGAAALSAEDPSLFWLAADIVAAGFDVAAAGGAALRLFRQLAPLAKALRGARAGEALTTLERNAAELGGEALANSVGKHASELQRGAAKEIGVTAGEARQFEQAASDVAAQELKEGAQIAEAAAQGQVKVSRAGAIFGCDSPCTMLRERYKDVLVSEPKFAQRLEKLERRARGLPRGAAGDAARKQIADEALLLKQELRAFKIGSTLKALGSSSKYRILQDAGLDAAAIERVLAKAGNIGQMKGQLLEELLASRVKSMLQTEAGKTALAGGRATATLEFIEGHRITDAAGRQFTDGVIAVREGKKLRIVTIFESKAGHASSRGLKYSYTSMKDLSEEELKILRMEAIEELREQNKAMARLGSAEIESKYPKQVDQMMQQLTKGEAGQVRKDIERLVPNFGEKTTTIKIDKANVEVIGGAKSTKTIGVLPSDVSAAKMTAGFQGQGLKYEAMNLDIKQGDLKKLAEDLANTLVTEL